MKKEIWHDASKEQPASHDDVLIVRRGQVTASVGWYGATSGQWRIHDESKPGRIWEKASDVEWWMYFPTTLPNGDSVA